MSVNCHSCGADFETFSELASHIMSEPRRTHKHGRKWASSLLLKVSQLNKKDDFENRTKLTEQEKENKRDTKIELSGEKTYVNSKCPACKRVHPEVVEVEFARSRDAWRVGDNFMILCHGCRRD